MPQVPTYDGPQVRAQALQPVFQRAPDVSSGAQSIARGLGQVAEVADRQVQRQVETESNKLDTEITAGWLEWNTAALRNPAYRGEGVAQYEADAAKWWDDAKQKYTSVASPMVREQLGLSLGRKRTQAVGSVAGYATQERERFADDQAEAAAQKTIEFGIDTGDTAGAAARVRQIAAEKGARKGWSTEMVMAEQQKHLGNLHLSHITRLAESNPVKAREYYEANKGEIPGTAQPRVEQVLKAEADNQFASQFAAGVAAKPLAEQLSEAAKIDNPERREKALTQIRNNHALVKAAQAEREQVVKDQAWQLVGQGKKVPEALLAQMDGRGRVELQDYLRTRAKQASEGTTVKTDWATYISLRERLIAGENVNITPYTTKLAGPQIEQLLDIKTKASASGTGSTKQDSMLTDEQRLIRSAPPLLDPKKDPEGYGRYVTEVDRRVRAESAAKGGKDLTADEKQKIIDAVVTDRVYVNEWGSDPQKLTSQLTPEEQSKAYVVVNGKQVNVSVVPRADRQQAIQALRQTNQPVTEQAIVEMYLEGQARNKPKTSTTAAPGKTARAPGERPSIYASPEEWARYRAEQASTK